MESEGVAIRGLRQMLLAVVVAPVRVYQALISPALPVRCKYEPSCSSYAIEALRSYGWCADRSLPPGACFVATLSHGDTTRLMRRCYFGAARRKLIRRRGPRGSGTSTGAAA